VLLITVFRKKSQYPTDCGAGRSNIRLYYVQIAIDMWLPVRKFLSTQRQWIAGIKNELRSAGGLRLKRKEKQNIKELSMPQALTKMQNSMLSAWRNKGDSGFWPAHSSVSYFASFLRFLEQKKVISCRKAAYLATMT